MDFFYRNKVKIRNILLAILTLIVFSLSYYICIHKIRSTNTESDKQKVVNVNSDLNSKVSSNARVVFNVKYIKGGDIKKEKEEDAGNLTGKTKGQLNEMYKGEGYKVESITPSRVVLVKGIDKYAPDKYVVGIKNGYIAIYRTNKNGDMFIENKTRDITDIKTDRLKKADIDLLVKGDKYFECNTREDAEARLEDYE